MLEEIYSPESVFLPIWNQDHEVAAYVRLDDEDVHFWFEHNWYLSRGYAITITSRRPKRKTLRLARLVMNAPEGIEVDHVNGDPLDNRRSNLRLCNRQQNGINRKVSKANRSGFKGVWKRNGAKKWTARIKYGGKQIHVGMFDHAEDAARAYNETARQLFGEFAFLNPV